MPTNHNQPFESHKRLDPAFKELVASRRQAGANAQYWVYAAMKNAAPDIEAQVVTEEHLVVTQTAPAKTVRTSVTEMPATVEDFVLGQDDDINPHLLDALEADKGRKGDYDLAA